ncbi:hypothetical protein CIHG_00099 [Coccidioides immitis H538.4]|uniref:Uncharacterized protein n=3 Tax=Coccidioides immitis TaxID=5501 RepID=A0A0J8QYP5_COCIT|nr:hypothetical protein CIRG_06921 [Coccidioides immitis RMSCC 2394]KMU78024.1 hypothetical protein CISG_06786 [Coccidioides immitis RMSCC 3703]KMU82315.1 hypothetical protein CIHG_00099 [Coccidioides immitis H538.4]
MASMLPWLWKRDKQAERIYRTNVPPNDSERGVRNKKERNPLLFRAMSIAGRGLQCNSSPSPKIPEWRSLIVHAVTQTLHAWFPIA